MEQWPVARDKERSNSTKKKGRKILTLGLTGSRGKKGVARRPTGGMGLKKISECGGHVGASREHGVELPVREDKRER